MTSQINNNTSIDYLKIGTRAFPTKPSDHKHPSFFLESFYSSIAHVFRGCRLASSSKAIIAGYTHSLGVVDGDDVLQAVIGIQDNMDHVCIEISGGRHDTCAALVLSDLFSDSSTWLMRFDIAFDFYESDISYSEMASTLSELATELKTFQSSIESYSPTKKLRALTGYAGPRTGYCFARVYEKSRQLELDGPKWNRLELEIKPNKEDRNKAHRYEIKDDLIAYLEEGSPRVLQYSRLGSRVATVVHGRELVALKRTCRHYNEDVRSVAYMLVQYKKRVSAVKNKYPLSLDALTALCDDGAARGYSDKVLVDMLCSAIQGE